MKEKHAGIGRIGLREALSVPPRPDKKLILEFAGISTGLMGGVMGAFDILNRLQEGNLNIASIAAKNSALGLLFGAIATLGYLSTAARQRGWGKNRDL